jgi:hypothetical protein
MAELFVGKDQQTLSLIAASMREYIERHQLQQLDYYVLEMREIYQLRNPHLPHLSEHKQLILHTTHFDTIHYNSQLWNG